jgi:hypothetical protein
MRLRIAPKIVIRVSTILVLSANFDGAVASGGPQSGNRANVFVNQEPFKTLTTSP